MTAARRRYPRAPGGLATAGRALWRRLHEVPDDPEGVVRFEPRELVILEAACRQADDIARLQELIDADGMVVKGSQGQPRLSSLVTEVRQARLAMTKLIGELELPDFTAQPAGGEQGQPPALSARSRQARNAARRRWDNEARRKGFLDGTG